PKKARTKCCTEYSALFHSGAFIAGSRYWVGQGREVASDVSEGHQKWGLLFLARRSIVFCREAQCFINRRKSHREETTRGFVFCLCTCLSTVHPAFRAG